MSAQIINHPNHKPGNLEMETKPNIVELEVPPLGAVLSYRVVWALCTITRPPGGRQTLRATHFATVLTSGREPLWGVWTVNGVFQRFFGRRSQIEEAYSKLVWRRKDSMWTLADIRDMDHSEKMTNLHAVYHKGDKIDGTEMHRVKS